MEEVPCRTSLVPLAFPCFVLCLIGVETEGLLDYQGRAGIISIVRWNLRPVIFGPDFCRAYVISGDLRQHVGTVRAFEGASAEGVDGTTSQAAVAQRLIHEFDHFRKAHDPETRGSGTLQTGTLQTGTLRIRDKSLDPWQVPRIGPLSKEEEGRKRQDPSDKNWRPANPLKNVRLSSHWSSKYPFLKYPFAKLPGG